MIKKLARWILRNEIEVPLFEKDLREAIRLGENIENKTFYLSRTLFVDFSKVYMNNCKLVAIEPMDHVIDFTPHANFNMFKNIMLFDGKNKWTKNSGVHFGTCSKSNQVLGIDREVKKNK